MMARDPENDIPAQALLGIVPQRHASRTWLLPLTLWEQLHGWEPPQHAQLFLKLYEFVALNRKVHRIRPWKQRVREVLECELDLWDLKLPARKRKRREGGRGGRGRARGRGRQRGRGVPIEDLDADDEKDDGDAGNDSDALRAFGDFSDHNGESKPPSVESDPETEHSNGNQSHAGSGLKKMHGKDSGSEVFLPDSSSSSGIKNFPDTIRGFIEMAQDQVLGPPDPPRMPREPSEAPSTPPVQPSGPGSTVPPVPMFAPPVPPSPVPSSVASLGDGDPLERIPSLMWERRDKEIEVRGGRVVYFRRWNRLMAICEGRGHGKCVVGRSCKSSPIKGREGQGRPFSWLVSWLGACPVDIDRSTHVLSWEPPLVERRQTRVQLSRSPIYDEWFKLERDLRPGEPDEPNTVPR